MELFMIIVNGFQPLTIITKCSILDVATVLDPPLEPCTMRNKGIKAALENTTTPAYISFCSYVAQDFENFLQTFQANEPMIHMLYPEICRLFTNRMSKFIRKNILSQNSQENVGIDLLKVENQKSKKNVENGVKTRLILGDSNLVSSENQDAFRKSSLKFYSTATKYLQEHLPLNVSVIPHAELENKLSVVFGTNDTKKGICDMICNQWMAYQNEPLPESYHLCQKKPTMFTCTQYSCWKCNLEECGLQRKEIRNSRCKRIDHFWSKVGDIIDDNGRKKYPLLFNLVKCVFCLSHANSVPERGFSIN